MNEFDLQRVYIFPIYPRDSKIHSIRVFVNTDNGNMGGTHLICFIIKDNKSYSFDSFGGAPDKFLPNQLPKPIIYHNYKQQEILSKLCCSYERMNYYDAIFEMYFDTINALINVLWNLFLLT